jgi:hypothetical protein
MWLCALVRTGITQMSVNHGKVPVCRRALVVRINRKLAGSGEMLRAARGARLRRELGRFYRVDTRRNCLVEKNVDLEQFARKLRSLKAWEALT